VALSLAPRRRLHRGRGLITHDWTDARTPDGLDVVVVLDVRPGNPKGFEDFEDLAASGIGVLTPDPASSGGARWNIVSIYAPPCTGTPGRQRAMRSARRSS